MMRFGNATVLLRRAPLVLDPRRNVRVRDWTLAEHFELRGLSIQDYPVVSDHADDRAREFSGQWFLVVAPPTIDPVPEHTDRIVYAGKEYEMRGDARPAHDRQQRLHHYEWVMRRQTETVGRS